MIAKLTTGNGFGGSLRYDTRAGKDTAKELARVLDASGVSFDFDEKGNLLINPKQVGFDFRQQTMGYTGEGVIRKPVYHWVLSYSPKDNVSEEQMLKDANEFLKRIGFDNTQRVTTVHYDKKHDHLHIVTNVVDNQGNRIPTMGLIDKAHAAALAITKENGYTIGEKTKKENITKERMHKPHERARETIEPMIREALAASTSFHDFQEKLIMDYGIMCNFTVAKDGNRGRLSFCYEYEGQKHSFNGSSIARDLSFGYVDKAIKANYKQAQEKYNDIKAGYNSVIPPIAKELVSIRNNCYQLLKDTTDAKIVVKTKTSEKYNELRSLWKQFNELNETRRNEKDTVKLTEALGGMLMLLNPIVGLSVIFLARISGDVRESSQSEQKQQILDKIESVWKEIKELEAQKAQLNIKSSEHLKDYLDAKQMLQEYKDGLNTLDTTISETKIDLLKQEFPFKDEGHIQYIIHGRTDASIFRAEEDIGIYRRVPSGKFSKYTGTELTEDYYEKARLALKERILFVAADRGPTAFYDSLLEEKNNGNFRVGDMQIHPDGKISFGQERIFGDPQQTEHNVPKDIETIKQTIPVVEPPKPKPTPVQAPTPAPQQKPSFEIVKTFTCDYSKFRIKKEEDGVFKLQHLEPDTKSPVIDHKYSKEAWFNKAKFTSFQEVAKDHNGVYFKIKDLEGKTRYINQYGVDLSNKAKVRLGLSKNNGISM